MIYTVWIALFSMLSTTCTLVLCVSSVVMCLLKAFSNLFHLIFCRFIGIHFIFWMSNLFKYLNFYSFSSRGGFAVHFINCGLWWAEVFHLEKIHYINYFYGACFLCLMKEIFSTSRSRRYYFTFVSWRS